MIPKLRQVKQISDLQYRSSAHLLGTIVLHYMLCTYTIGQRTRDKHTQFNLFLGALILPKKVLL